MPVNINPKKLAGDWKEGFALDIQTTKTVFAGRDASGRTIFDSTRSEIGSLLYRLKYGGDQTAVNEIADTAHSFLRSWGPPVEIVVPVPPSNKLRKFQPVIEIARKMSIITKLPICEDCISKVRNTAERKNFANIKEWMVNLEDALVVDSKEIRDKTLLLFDDLYQSGATATVITRKLMRGGGATAVYFLAITRARKLYTWGV